ncbi:MAG: KUP/HAK/KT family potassium transporter, partial [Deltaproteobacteria bacterium]|nr:KUP/HAK/KT family potassium transporter [Deltaproteobacteria bacterium]
MSTVKEAHTGNKDTPTTSGQNLYVLALSALGVVYGDIGTSPLYALKEAFSGPYSISVTPPNVLGILSLIFWVLTFVVIIKYLTFIMKADNRGEGGILALLAIMSPLGVPTLKHRSFLIVLGLFGAALLYGDGVITPAISVLSAVEGLEVATPTIAQFVVPMTIAILVPLFLDQKRGTASVGSVFGPITLIWFFSIAATGLTQIIRHPQVFAAINPLYATDFFARNGFGSLLVLGAVVLVV